MVPIVKAENLGVAYNLGKSSEVWALKNVNFEIYPGEYIIFFGPSGCGKSTLLYTIAGLEFPTEGKMIVEGKDLSLLSQKELIKFRLSTIGMIFQAFYLIPTLSVKDNILLPQILAGENQKSREKKARLLMERFGILELQKRKPNLLSGGQQQRVAIARALINDPSIILADEPVGNLDSKNAEIVMELLYEFNQKEKKTIVLVTHDPRHLHYGNRVFYLKDGKIVRVVTNYKKTTVFPSKIKEGSQLEKLAQLYPYLPDSRLKAKLILNHLFLPYDIEVLQKIEETIENYLLKKIDTKELFETLDKPPINLYFQTARDLTEKIKKLAEEMEIIEIEERLLTPLEERAKLIRTYLLDNWRGKLTFEQIKRLDEAILQRLTGQLSQENFEKFLDTPFKKGGVGLNRRTAKRFTREIELILMQK